MLFTKKQLKNLPPLYNGIFSCWEFWKGQERPKNVFLFCKVLSVPDERPGDGAVDPLPGLVNVEEPGREDDWVDPVAGPLEDPGRPGLGRNAIGLITTLPWK